MKIPEHDETEDLINLANNLEVMRLVHNLPRKIIKLLCYSLKREYEMRVARDKRINRLIIEVDRQRGLYRASVMAKNATTETDLKAENEKLRGQAMRVIVAFDPDNDLDNPEKFNAYHDLEAALKGESNV